ncbi:uncharacterized protein CANTADRAFT_91349 [Suhomyces tanzawaensis NRRL Y-17324]|uniref:ATPase synthesis protein 25 n=1 Tax=Suhomyces tanzawaensis NRRL Y-17324 TaxID=984487 RepID=A0A1E4SEI0_9ASCO|nr:uncharacterized protein CANTADRAFT_91349 [Suhomyces tanzawaensis NRRL Y-17324]ODV77898.1 hypothetical protein CANTADRAFT_91349 [Suhomyces tanzawaensis NRRL Y-17324]
MPSHLSYPDLGSSEFTHPSQHSDSTPWYLREDATSPLVEAKEIELPTIPGNSPESLNKFLNLLAYDYGIQDLVLFDTSTLEEDHPYSTKEQPTNYYIIGTGKSEKHIYKAASELRSHIKHTHNIIPPMEGMVSGGVKPVVRRRLLRRARKGPPATDNDYGKLPNSWIMCDTKVDGVYIHMLTQQRRDELNLESLYCPEEELEQYETSNGQFADSDDIFIGIRRMHTMTPFARHNQARFNSTTSQSIYSRLINENQQITNEDVKKYSKEFLKTFREDSLEDHRVRYKFYRALHLVKPEFVSLEELEQMLLSKYASLPIALAERHQLEENRQQDIIDYMKLLVDSPEVSENIQFKTVGEHCDYIYDALSKFVSKVLLYSPSQVDLLSNPEFTALLWRLSYVESGPFVGSNTINDIIYNDKLIPSESTTSIDQAKNRARDILEIIKYHNSVTNTCTTPSFKELILFTYGNDGNWKQFWKQWDSSLGSWNNETDSKTLLGYWVRLAVYLSCRHSKTATIHFLHNYWNHSLNGRSFMGDFNANGGRFGSEQEHHAFTLAINAMLRDLNGYEKSASFNHIKQFIEGL